MQAADDRGNVSDLTRAVPGYGWYPDPDPSNPAGMRWWDGIAWTAHVRTPQPITAPEFRSPAPTMATVGPEPNHPATRAIVAAGLVTASLGGSVVFHLPTAVPFVATGIAIVFGIIGLVKSRSVFSGAKRSIAAIAIGAVALVIIIGSVVAAMSYDFSADLERSLTSELSVAGLPVAVLAVDCPAMATPKVGTIVGCSVTFVDGTVYEVTIKMVDGVGDYMITGLAAPVTT